MSVITCHRNESQVVRGEHDLRWIDPSGTHFYRGVGRFEDGQEPQWSPCSRCGEEREHHDHGAPWRLCSLCGSIHPEDLLLQPEPTPMRTIEIADGKTMDVPSIEWADWINGVPMKMYFDFGIGLEAKFHSPHLIDHVELLEQFNEVYGYLGPRFYIKGKTLVWRMGT